MKNKFLALLSAASLALMMQACGDDSSSVVDFDGEDSSSSIESEKNSSSSEKENVSADSSSSESKDAASSSSAANSSDSKPEQSSSSINDGSSSSITTTIDVSKLNAYVFASDYVTGALHWVENGKISKESVKLGQDSKIINIDGKLVALSRSSGADVISVFDKSTKTISVQANISDYGISNPQDAVIFGNEIWVSSESEIISFNSKLEGNSAIDLSGFASGEGQDANVIDLELSHDTLFVLMQRYIKDGYLISFPKGMLALFSLKSEGDEALYLEKGDALAEIELATTNPMSVKVVKGEVYVATHGAYNNAYGTDADNLRGIEKIDLKAQKSTLYISGEKLGGGVMNMEVDYSKGIAYAGIRGNAYGEKTPLVKIDLSKKSVEKIKDFYDIDSRLAYDSKSGLLLVGDHGTTENYTDYIDYGVYVYNGNILQKIEYADETALPPYSIAF